MAELITVDISGLIEHQARWLKALEPRWQGFALLAAETIRRYVVESMIATPLGAGEFSSGNRLHVLSGELGRSFAPGAPFNIYRVDINTNRVEVAVGSRSLHLHEEAKRTTASQKMIAFFWAQYIKTQLPKWRIIALSAKKKGYIMQRAMPLRDPIEKRMLSEGLDRLGLDAAELLVESWMVTAG